MTEVTENGCMVYKPTLVERFWRWAGYRYHLQELPEDSNNMPGWAMTHIRVNFSLADRLRLLISGRVQFDVRQAMSAEVESVISATSISIRQPGLNWDRS